ncbi:hypothetical protein Goarm_002098 [Gossypium armourianum]|uniref:DUF4219 domain-containing protein n=1 Tax=Gossypium armourianum TaxID=34283 RepID=A0A7J9K723_9ROSI|nr:hypothetical protein [Gossypium armourianum]
MKGHSTSRPPMLEVDNYAYWKTSMRSYIKLFDEKGWCVVLIGWESSTIDSKSGKVTKLEARLTVVKERFANANSRALYAIFCGMDMQEFKRIAKCTVTKGFSLGKEYSNTKRVRNVLRSLPERFSTKVTIIKEVEDLESLVIDEFIVSLQTFEINLVDFKHNKTKGERNISFQIGEGMSTFQNAAIEKIQEQIASLTKNFKKTFKKQLRRIKKFETSTNAPRNESNGVDHYNFFIFVAGIVGNGDFDLGSDKEVEAKEFLLVEELASFVKVKKELADTKFMLEKFNTSNNQLNEILVAKKRDPGK